MVCSYWKLMIGLQLFIVSLSISMSISVLELAGPKKCKNIFLQGLENSRCSKKTSSPFLPRPDSPLCSPFFSAQDGYKNRPEMCPFGSKESYSVLEVLSWANNTAGSLKASSLTFWSLLPKNTFQSEWFQIFTKLTLSKLTLSNLCKVKAFKS